MVRICKNGKKKYKSLGISVNPAHWDFKKNLPKPKCPNHEALLIINKRISVFIENIPDSNLFIYAFFNLYLIGMFLFL